MVGEFGSRSRSTEAFMLPADISRFSDLLAPQTAGLGVWRADRSLESYPRLTDALAADREIQAFLHPVGPDEAPVGPMIQFLTGRVRIVHIDRTIRPDGRHMPVSIDRETLPSGRLAFKWFPDQHPSPVQEAFAELSRLTWRCLNAVTAPHLAQLHDAKPVRNPRIGMAAEEWALEDDSRGLFRPGIWYQVKG